MGSNAVPTVNLLEYLQSRTQVDYDSLDFDGAAELGPFADCTSNQAEAYTELLNPQRASLLKGSVALAKDLRSEFPNVTFQELAVEICMINLALSITPKITGTIHVMANPLYAYSTAKVVETGLRFHRLLHYLSPTFPLSRLCMKVASTWEGLQACRKLKPLGIKTLATTVFTMEQCVLAGEAGCEYISPFVHELKVHFDESYKDENPILSLCVQAQRYYEQQGIPTRVKACAVVDADECMQLAGVSAFTIPLMLLRELASTSESEAKVEESSLFNANATTKGQEMGMVSYIDEELKFREAFRSDGGIGQSRTGQAINIFCDFQHKAEAMMRQADAARAS